MFTTTVALVGEFTVTDTTLTPVPLNMAVVVFCTQCVNIPVMVSDSFCWPCWPVFGFTCVITGVPLVTVKPLVKRRDFRIRRQRYVACGCCRRRVDVDHHCRTGGRVTVTDTTLTPVPLNMAVVVFCTQCVNIR